MARKAADEGKLDKARTWGKTSLGFNIAGIVVTVLIVIAVGVVVATRDSDDYSTGFFCGRERCSATDRCCGSSFSRYCC